MIRRFFNFQSKTVTGAAIILAASALVSRLLGLARDWLLADMFGTGPEIDIYFAAFRIPDMVYAILIAGGVIVAFLPLFSEYFSKDKKEAWRFTNNTMNIFFVLLVVFCFVLFIFTPVLVKLITPGFDSYQLAKTVFLTRLMFLSPIFLGLSSIFSGILQYFNRFLAYSMAPIFYNLGIILGLLFLTPKFGIVGVAMGVILGAFLHIIIQIPSAISCGLKYRPIFNIKDPGIKKVFILMIPRTLGVVGLQINLFVITAIASNLTTGSISVFNFANNLQGLISGIIGVSFATAVFPSLSRAWINKGKDEFLRRFSSVFRQIMYIITPLSILLFMLRSQIVEIVLKHGMFGQFSAQLTSASVGLFSLSIFAFSLIPLLARTFYSLQDTKTPAIIVFFVILTNILLSIYLTSVLQPGNFLHDFINGIFSLQTIKDIRVVALPLAYSISMILEFFLLFIFLLRRLKNLDQKNIMVSSAKMILAGIIMIIIMNIIAGLFDSKSPAFTDLISQSLIVAVAGGLVYMMSTFFLKSPEVSIIFNKIKNRLNGKNT